MNTRTLLSTLGVLCLLLGGCASDASDTGAPLVSVDVDAMTSQTLYVVSDEAMPLTAAQLAESPAAETAIPVRVEIFENTAVAWHAPEGEAIVSRDTIIALWTVYERTPISNPTASSPGDAPVTNPGYAVDLAREVPASYDGDPASVEQTDLLAPAEIAILAFYDKVGTPEEFAMLEELIGYHPGCL